MVTVWYEQPLMPLLFSPDHELPKVGLGGGMRGILGGILSVSPPAGTAPMLTSKDEVDEKLRKMNEGVSRGSVVVPPLLDPILVQRGARLNRMQILIQISQYLSTILNSLFSKTRRDTSEQ